MNVADKASGAPSFPKERVGNGLTNRRRPEQRSIPHPSLREGRGTRFRLSTFIAVLLNQGDGTFADELLYGGGEGPRSMCIGDLDSDGDLDLAVANFNGDNVSILLNVCIP